MLRRSLKITALALATLLALAGAALLVVSIRGIPSYSAKPPALSLERTPERVARGKKLASLLCVGCHENASTHRLTGKRLAELPPAFGEVFSSNITAHPSRGIGAWSDGELAYLLRTGIRPDGRYLPPWMIKLPHLSDEDLASLIAYLRSDDPPLAASDASPPGVTRPSLLSKVLTNTIMKPLPYPAAPIVAPARNDRVAFGRYLTLALDCFSCHSTDFKRIDMLAPERSAGYLGGGGVLIGVEGQEVVAANLTPDEETGIGRWSEAEFVRALREGFRPDGRALRYPMLVRNELDADEAGAIYAYLRTVPKIRNDVRPQTQPIAASWSTGRKLYAQYGCTGCHGSDGAGTSDVPDLRHVAVHFASDAELRAWMENPQAQKPDSKMPAWKNIIADKDFGPLLAYVRSLGSR